MSLKKKEKSLKRFIVRKYIIAESALEAIKLSRGTVPDDVFIDNDWIQDNKSFGFEKEK